MDVFTRITNHGISISVGGRPPAPVEADPRASQTSPMGFYVYGHARPDGVLFYVGTGTRDRAWSSDRHHLWGWYVERHLGGKYTVRILKDNLARDAAEELESEWIAQESDTLVNWVNMGRKTDFKALDRFHALRGEAREWLERAKQLEPSDAEGAVAACRTALALVHEYASIKYEGGLVGQLMDEYARHVGQKGELAAIDRLSVILVRAKRKAEACLEVSNYFERYPGDLRLAAAPKVLKRVGVSMPS